MSHMYVTLMIVDRWQIFLNMSKISHQHACRNTSAAIDLAVTVSRYSTTEASRSSVLVMFTTCRSG